MPRKSSTHPARPHAGKPRPTLAPPKLWLFRFLAIAIPVLGLEAAARVYWTQFVAPPKSESGIYEEVLGTRVLGDEVPYQFRPNHTFVVASTPTSTNNLAIRGDYDVDLSRPYSGRRIVCVGDSVTFGYTVSGNGASYPAVLETLLRDGGMDCQVLNAGMPRFRIQHVARMFADHFRHYQADTVIILGGWNNANDRVLMPSGKRSWMSFLNEHWFTLKVVRSWKLLPQLGAREHPPARIDHNGYNDYARSLEELIGMIRTSGAQPILCTLPHFFHHVESLEAADKAATFTPHGTLDQLATVADTMNARIRQLAVEQHAPLVELDDIAQHEDFGDAIHPNDAGSRAIAERVASFLLSQRRVSAE